MDGEIIYFQIEPRLLGMRSSFKVRPAPLAVQWERWDSLPKKQGIDLRLELRRGKWGSS